MLDALYPPPPPTWITSPLAFAEQMYGTHPEAIWKRARHLEVMEEAFLRTINKRGGRLAVEVSVRHAKALGVDTPIITPTGWRKMGDLRPGDQVWAPDGTATNVVRIAPQPDAPIHRITFDDGTFIDAHPEHDWVTLNVAESCSYQSTYKRRTGEHPTGYPGDWWNIRSSGQGTHGGMGPSIRQSQELAATVLDRRGHRNHRIPNCSPLGGVEADLPIHPWLLGYWLGNGNSWDGTVTCGSMVGGDRPDRDWVADKLTSLGYEVHFRADGNGLGIYGLRAALRDLGVLQNKHVPESYLLASEGQRRDLLAGLMDSDGTNEMSLRNKGRVSFTSMEPQLAESVAHLFVSLGAKVQRSTSDA